MKVRAALICAAAAALATECRAQYSTGFESPVFTSGEIAGQDSWTTSQNPATSRVLANSEIATELTNAGLTPGQTVHGGTQALLVSGSGLSNATIRAMPGLEAQPIIRLDVWTRPLSAGTTGAALGNIFLTIEDSVGTRAAAFRFGTAFGQTIDYGTNIGTVWQPTSILWDTDTWYRLTLDVDYSAKTYNMAINGTLVNSSPIPFYNSLSASFSQVRIFRGTNQAGMITDDLSVFAIPEPTSAAFVLMGASGLCLPRRRRQH
jgi:hypothetical protein